MLRCENLGSLTFQIFILDSFASKVNDPKAKEKYRTFQLQKLHPLYKGKRTGNGGVIACLPSITSTLSTLSGVVCVAVVAPVGLINFR